MTCEFKPTIVLSAGLSFLKIQFKPYAYATKFEKTPIKWLNFNCNWSKLFEKKDFYYTFKSWQKISYFLCYDSHLWFIYSMTPEGRHFPCSLLHAVHNYPLHFVVLAACVDVYGTHSNVHLSCFHTGKSTAMCVALRNHHRPS